MQRVLLTTLLLVIGFTLSSVMLLAGKPAKGVHTVVDLNVKEDVLPHRNAVKGEYGELLGGTVDGKWLLGDEISARLKAGEPYRVYSQAALLGIGTGDLPKDDPDDVGSPTLGITLPDGVKTDDTLIAIQGEWNALPRVPKEQSVKQPVYEKVVRNYLASQKAPKEAKTNITRILRIDLEGDGTEEVLISAMTPNKDIVFTSGENGDYAVVLMRKIVDDRVVTIPLETYIYGTKNSYPYLYTLESVFDVNGDGVMEIITGWKYHEGRGKTIYEVKGKKAIPRVSGGVAV